MDPCPDCGSPRSEKRKGRCYYCHWRRLKAAGRTPGRPRRGEWKVCLTCGVRFYTTSHEQARARRFCSHRCWNAHQSQEYGRTWRDRFWAKVDKSGECWMWTGKRFSTNGYGVGSIRGKSTGAHRVSWELHNGPIPKGKFIRHRCDTKACVRPDHLQLGDPVDNVADRVVRERRRPKLAQDRVRAIRALHAGGFDAEAIGSILRLSASTVKSILTAL